MLLDASILFPGNNLIGATILFSGRPYIWAMLLQTHNYVTATYVGMVVARMCSVWSHRFVYVRTYVRICQQKNRLFSALLLENLLLSVIYCLLLNASSVVCYIQRAIQTEQFMPFQIRHELRPPQAPKYFLLSFNGTSYPLG